MAGRDMKQVVKDRYGKAATRVRAGGEGCCADERDPITADLYDETDRSELPVEALQASLGCGNPAALAELHSGETVLDLGSGGGIDVLLSARRVGPTGKAYGLDMTDEMLALAEENKTRAGVTNAEFLCGEIEDIPLPDEAVDVIISNCVINLSVDKDRVFAEAFRVLRPGGRLAVSDMVLCAPLPPEIAELVAAWTGCVAGALEESQYRAKLAAAGFVQVDVQPTRVFSDDDAREFLSGQHLDADRLAPQLAGVVISAFVRAVKPRKTPADKVFEVGARCNDPSRFVSSGSVHRRPIRAASILRKGVRACEADKGENGERRETPWYSRPDSQCCGVRRHVGTLVACGNDEQ